MNEVPARNLIALANEHNATQNRRLVIPVPLLNVLVWLSLALIVLVAYYPALDNGFVNWDDDENFLDNFDFRGFKFSQIKWAWLTFRGAVYQPLGWLLLETQYVLWGLNAFYYHLTSIVLHALNMVFLCVLTIRLLTLCQLRLCKNNPQTCILAAGLATALFAVHPLRVEVVAWASCQSYLPAILFSMLTVLAYLRAFEPASHPKRGWLLITFVLFVIALLFKAVAVSIPVVLFILDIHPLRRLGIGSEHRVGSEALRALLEKVPFILVSMVFMALALAAKVGSEIPVDFNSTVDALARMSYSSCFYIFKTLLPLNLKAIYAAPYDTDWRTMPIILSIAGIIGVCALLWLLRIRWPGLLTVWLAYFAILAPTSGIVRFNEQIVADRYCYMAMLGGVVLLAGGFCQLSQFRVWKYPASLGLLVLGLTLLIGLIPLTRKQCRTWHDAQSLWAHAINHGAALNSQVHGNLALYFQRNGKLESAMAEYRQAIRLNPLDVSARSNLGVVLSRYGKPAEAEMQQREAIRLDSNFANAHYNLAMILARQERFADAEFHYTEALRIKPNAPDAHYNLAMTLSQQSKYAEAARHYIAALRLNPNLAAAYNNLGTDLARQGNLAEAEAQYTQALRLDPRRADTHTNLGIVLARQHKLEEAAAHYSEALRLDPAYHEARKQLRLIHPH